MKRVKRIVLLVFILAVGVMAYSGEQWLSIDKVYQEGNDAYADYSAIVRRLPAYGPEDAPKNGSSADNIRHDDLYTGDTGGVTTGGAPQDIINAAGTPAPAYSADEGGTPGGTQAPHNDAPQGTPAPEHPQGTAPNQDGNTNANTDATAQGNDQNPAQSASPAPAREDPWPTPSASETAVIAAPEMTPPTATPAPQATPTPQSTPDSNSPIDFDALKAINRNAVAWLYSPYTPIDYPVMRTSDYSYYLDRLPDGRKNANGSLFIDYNNASDFSGALTVIYGHNMKTGKMFGSLPSYKSQSYYNQHPYMYLYTERRSYRLDLIYGCSIAEGQWRERSFMYAENVNSLMSYASHYTTFKSNTSYKSGDRVVVLSTCTFEFNDARYIVLGVLRGI